MKESPTANVSRLRLEVGGSEGLAAELQGEAMCDSTLAQADSSHATIYVQVGGVVLGQERGEDRGLLLTLRRRAPTFARRTGS